MITTEVPKNWRHLQNMVAEILSECGFVVEVEKTIETVRGTVEIDVYAEEEIMGRKNIIICECKLWKQKIPKTVVHSFRTVLSDFGANAGYIISSKGYQKGAYEAAQYTNTNLMSWEQFQITFEEFWYRNYFQKKITKELDSFFEYTEPFLPRWVDKLSQEEKSGYFALKEKYDLFGQIMMMVTSHFSTLLSMKGILSGKVDMIPLPIKNITNYQNLYIPNEIEAILTYREFLNFIIEYGKNAINEFRYYRDLANSR